MYFLSQSTVFIILALVAAVEMCTDSQSNCASWAANGFCSSTFYTDSQKTQYCGATCNLCGGSSSGTTIASSAATDSSDVTTVDTTGSSSSDTSAATTSGTETCKDNSSACASWASNGYCTNDFYTVAQRQQNCAKTCSLC